MGALRDYFENNGGREIHKWHHYFEIYERHFERYRGRPVNVLEIGVFRGGSLQMWKQYFGDQSDRDFLRRLRASLPRIDVLIDDGGHTMSQQIATFEELYGHVADDGT